jgi:hypothetical protein
LGNTERTAYNQGKEKRSQSKRLPTGRTDLKYAGRNGANTQGETVQIRRAKRCKYAGRNGSNTQGETVQIRRAKRFKYAGRNDANTQGETVQIRRAKRCKYAGRNDAGRGLWNLSLWSWVTGLQGVENIEGGVVLALFVISE